jgi:predicted dehydrogenase
MKTNYRKGEKMKPYRVAVIGCGTIANSAHLPALGRRQDIEIAYCIDLIKERAEKAAQQYGGENACADYREALADKTVDAIMVLTPNYAHYTVTIDALRAGKHVFCEKPITVDYKLSKEMADEAKKHNRILHIGVCNRYNRTVEIIRDYIRRGVLGEVYHVFGSYRNHRSIPGLGGYFTTKAESGGGVLIDWGVHFIDLILYALGQPKVTNVSANCYNKLGKNIGEYTYKDMWAGPPRPEGTCDVEEFVSSYIRTESCAMTLIGAWAQNIGENEMFIDFMGDKAGIRMDYYGKFKLYTAKNGVLYTETPDYIKPDMYAVEQDDFLRSTRTGEVTRGNIANVLQTAEVMGKIYLSGEQNKEVSL